LGIEAVVAARCNMDFTGNISGVFLQYPDTQGSVYDLTAFVNKAHANSVRISLRTIHITHANKHRSTAILCDPTYLSDANAVYCVGSRRVQNNLSPKIVVKTHHYPFARIDCLSDFTDTKSTDTRHKSAKFAKTCYTATTCPQHGGT